MTTLIRPLKKHDEATKDDLVKEDQEDTEEVEQNT